MREEFAIELKDLTVAYKTGCNVLSGINVEIFASEFIAIIGPNGAGKSTLLKTISGWLKKTGGTLKIFGKEIEKISSAFRASLMGMVPQFVDMPIPLTVREIVMIGRTGWISRWMGMSKYDEKLVNEAMRSTDTFMLADKLFSELSGGEKQRVLIAMVLAQEPKIILLDEATSHLDINHAVEIMQLIKKFNRERKLTILMASHDINMASLFADRIFVMQNGNIVCGGTPFEVLTVANIKRFYNCDVEVYHKNRQVYVMPVVKI